MKSLGKIETAIDQKFDVFAKQMKDASNDVAAVKALHEAQKSEMESLIGRWKAMQEQVDKIDGKVANQDKAKTSIYAELKAALSGGSAIEKVRNRQTFTHAFSEKAIMTYPDNVTGVVSPDTIATNDIIFMRDREVHVRNFLAGGSMSGDSLSYTRESAITNATAGVAQGALKPQSDVSLEEVRDQAKKIATHLRFSSEMLDDIPLLSSYLATRFLKKLRVEEDRQIIYGNGSATQLTGISTVAAPFFADAGSILYFADVVSRSKAFIAGKEYGATAVMIHPEDYSKYIETAKDDEGRYLFPDIYTTQNINISKLPIIATTAITEGDFLIGDFSMGAQLFDRKTAEMRMYEQDQDNAVKNLITAVFEERVALAIYRPDVFVYGNIASAIASYS